LSAVVQTTDKAMFLTFAGSAQSGKVLNQFDACSVKTEQASVTPLPLFLGIAPVGKFL
jgi:hypothetical protein